ncbi:hypothetical protein [Nonomuraea ceibae]|uniref:hypothetical protein n=1 Tax=Nonomuraea ceibae TaxID=1935170 RepID=UPI001C605CA7|nr:hypothetical protein [Nonomuraea ceibae]
MAIPDSPLMRYARLELADLLAAQVDSARREQPLETPLLNWYEGDAVVRLLKTLAQLLAGEPLGELSAELAEKLTARLGQPSGHDKESIHKAIAAIVEIYCSSEKPTSDRAVSPRSFDW